MKISNLWELIRKIYKKIKNKKIAQIVTKSAFFLIYIIYN